MTERPPRTKRQKDWSASVALLVTLIAGPTAARGADGAAVWKAVSPDGRYRVEFSRPLTTAARPDLWGRITVRDLASGVSRVAHQSPGRSTASGIWQAFGPYTEGEAWSPDGLYLAYWDLRCTEESASADNDAVCHSHEIAFLSLGAPAKDAHELVLDRYGFGGWKPGKPHTIIEINPASDGTTSFREPSASEH